MRIGHYAPDLWAKGGIATYVRRTGQAQTEAGHEVWYFGRAERKTKAPEGIPNQIVHDDNQLFAAADDVGLDVLHLHRAVDELPEERVPTVRTMHGHQGGCPSGSRYLARTRTPCNRAYSLVGCLWGHVVDRCGSVRPQRLLHSFTRIEHELAQAEKVPTFTVSDFLREQMIRAGCAPDVLHTIHSPAPVVNHPFTPVPREGTPRFLYLGRLVPQKGLEWLIRSIAQVDVPVQLDVAGEGPDRSKLEDLAHTLGISNQVVFHGWVDQANVATLMQEARGVVFPSVWHEPAGLVSLEAAAHGRALIGSRVGGIPEYAHASFARLVEPHDTEGLAHAIAALASAPDLADTLGQQGYTYAREARTMQSFIKQVDAWYLKACATHDVCASNIK